jgi:hypothetical protein
MTAPGEGTVITPKRGYDGTSKTVAGLAIPVKIGSCVIVYVMIHSAVAGAESFIIC